MDVQSVAPANGATAGSPQATTAGATAGSAPTGAAEVRPSAGAPQPPSGGSATLASAVAKLYNVTQSSSGAPQELDVSYKVVHQLDLIVTVFTNPETGQVVAQFPPEVLIGLAEFFDQTDGVTLDQKA
ncbi:MAG TPA: hypothetical protein VMF11_09765 [Candidatus Baltobacteraceae bacterium]|nr:hypothetical protein [Candidatus Baltobacteraceae bacterium]